MQGEEMTILSQFSQQGNTYKKKMRALQVTDYHTTIFLKIQSRVILCCIS